MAVDAAGNAYILSFSNNTAAILKWVAASNTLTQLPTPAIHPNWLSVDGRGNLYFLDGLDYSVRVIFASSGDLGTGRARWGAGATCWRLPWMLQEISMRRIRMARR